MRVLYLFKRNKKSQEDFDKISEKAIDTRRLRARLKSVPVVNIIHIK